MIRRDVLKNLAGIVTLPTIGLFGCVMTSAAMGQENGVVSDPWTTDESVSPAAFAKELADSAFGDKPTIICVGFHNFYESGHIPGASLHGPTSTADGLGDLKQFAQRLSRTAHVVIYCGCCPLVHCPNVRPAFIALREMGFADLRLLALTDSFGANWLKPGYPVAKSA